MKACTKCHRALPRDQFGASGKHYGDGLSSWCKECRRSAVRDLQRRPDQIEKRRSGVLKRTYGITLADYNAMIKAQGGGCAICGSPPEAEPDQRAMHVDHDHKTGKVRSILCTACNTGLGSFRDDPRLLSKAAVYLHQHDPSLAQMIQEVNQRGATLLAEAFMRRARGA